MAQSLRQWVCNGENQTDGLFQIGSRRAAFNLDKRTKIARRLLLSTLAYLLRLGLGQAMGAI